MTNYLVIKDEDAVWSLAATKEAAENSAKIAAFEHPNSVFQIAEVLGETRLDTRIVYRVKSFGE